MDALWWETAKRIGSEQQDCNNFVSFSPSPHESITRCLADGGGGCG